MTAMNDYYDIHTLQEFADTFGNMILCNEMAERMSLEPVNGTGVEEIFQWFIVENADFAIAHSEEPIFYDRELDLYIWGVTQFGTDWQYVRAPELIE